MRYAIQRCHIIALTTALLVGAAGAVRAEPATDCFSEDLNRRIAGCTELIERNVQNPVERAYAYATRALAYSLKGLYAAAIPDYDEAIRLQPDFAVALNNRAWAYYKWGKIDQGMVDVEKSLELSPTSPHSLDTRAHIHQAKGNSEAAMRDYDRAMWFGGPKMIKLYQCGLTEQRLYTGEIDGTWRQELTQALQKCVLDKNCDPLPADEHCRAATS
jgi:tetratricopeptide (TPR) repeat protein